MFFYNLTVVRNFLVETKSNKLRTYINILTIMNIFDSSIC